MTENWKQMTAAVVIRGCRTPVLLKLLHGGGEFTAGSRERLMSSFGVNECVRGEAPTLKAGAPRLDVRGDEPYE